MHWYGSSIFDDALRALLNEARVTNTTFLEMDERLAYEVRLLETVLPTVGPECWLEDAVYYERRTALWWQLGYCRVEGRWQIALRASECRDLDAVDADDEDAWIYAYLWAPRTVRLILRSHIPRLAAQLGAQA